MNVAKFRVEKKSCFYQLSLLFQSSFSSMRRFNSKESGIARLKRKVADRPRAGFFSGHRIENFARLAEINRHIAVGVIRFCEFPHLEIDGLSEYNTCN